MCLWVLLLNNNTWLGCRNKRMSDNLEESEHQDHEQQEKEEIETVNQTEFCIESILLNLIICLVINEAHDKC